MTDAPIRKNTQPMAAGGSMSAAAISQNAARAAIPTPADHQRTASVAEGGERVDGDEQPEPSGPVREIEGVVGRARERGRDKHCQGPAAADGHDRATDDQQDVSEIPEVG